MGYTLPIDRDNLPIIKFPATFSNIKKVKKNLRFENSVYGTKLKRQRQNVNKAKSI